MVSVIIATYRREESLFNALNSLTEQTYKNFEVIIVDDNADVEWNAKVEKVVFIFKNILQIKYIKNETNQGSAKTRNIGIAQSKGDFITFLDDDDLYLPQKIQNQLEKIVNSDADYSLMDLSLYNENETLAEIRRRDYLLTQESGNLLLCHLKYHMTGTDTMMFKTEYIKVIGGFEPIDVGDEFYLMMKAIENGGKFVYCQACDVKAYVHSREEGLSSGQGKIDGENKLYKFKKNYFYRLKNKDKRYIRMRHYAVIAYAYKRIGKVLHFIINGIKAFLVSPKGSISLLKHYKGQI